ncbi:MULTISPECIES: DUF2141 domain-containing protein [Flavobacteriaceae]|uniref:DUF2141 domain-containing protein n=1 Tax=Flavobacteriaceae TaxID=49546 RepID=UPI001492776F|nr:MULTISPECIES: DUF2141 domain-containing protein [Allomuricauda]MDC6365122.1 DUF2141 domain-containing protein [Muricauda sp. AC10]
MKTILLTFAFALTSLVGLAQETTGINIQVTIDKITSDTGQVLISLHTADTFMKGPGIQNLKSTIENGKVSLTFENVAPGDYAVMAMHDANGNNRMDYEINGMPKESYGMSGNDMSFGPPAFNDAKFTVENEDLEFNIRF